MSFSADCPFCRLQIERVPDDRSGMSLECPRCGSLFTLAATARPRKAANRFTANSSRGLLPTPGVRGDSAVAAALAQTTAQVLPATRSESYPTVPGSQRLVDENSGSSPLTCDPEHGTAARIPRTNAIGLGSFLLSTFALFFASVPGLGVLTLPMAAAALGLGVFGILYRPARKSGFYLATAGLMVGLPVLLVASFWPGLLGLPAREREEAAAPGEQTVYHLANLGVAAREAPKQTEWVDAGQDAVQETGVRVRVVSVAVRGVQLQDAKGQRRVGDRSLVIRLRVSNAGRDDLVHYQSWQEAASAGDGSNASVQDNLGRSYRPRNFGPTWQPRGGIHKAAIPAARWVDDVLVFEAPPPGIEYLRLQLPAPAFGARGMLQLQIPRRLIAFP